MPDKRALEGLEFMRERIEEMERQLAKAKEAANAFAETAGVTPPYKVNEHGGFRKVRAVRPDQFAGCTTPGAAARAYLNWRGPKMGAASVEEIYEGLSRGGYKFESGSSSAINGLRIALGKDKAVKRLANNYYGLEDWYVGPNPDVGPNPQETATLIYDTVVQSALSEPVESSGPKTINMAFFSLPDANAVEILSRLPGVLNVRVSGRTLDITFDPQGLQPSPAR